MYLLWQHFLLLDHDKSQDGIEDHKAKHHEPDSVVASSSKDDSTQQRTDERAKVHGERHVPHMLSDVFNGDGINDDGHANDVH